MPNNGNGWKDAIRAAQAFIWIVLIFAVCGLLLVLNEVMGRPVTW